ncbi:RNA polymerase sigma factor [Streptomyces sp. NPDC057271]|uniref:RNA polymerase sigma factor n=1 Tax=unclassified Streptomyces TaxID=2593676 RepID=UPI003639C887
MEAAEKGFGRAGWDGAHVVPVVDRARRVDAFVSGWDVESGNELLSARFQQQEERAVDEVFRTYGGAMFVTAFALLGCRESAADAVQRACTKAWQAAGEFDASRDIRPWLYAITRRAAIDVYRQNRRHAESVPLSALHECAGAGGAGDLEDAWQAWQVRRALERLERDESAVVCLAYYDGLTQREISIRLGIPLGTVKSRTSRALQRLSDLLAHL